MKVKMLLTAAVTLWAITSQADEQFPAIKANGQVYSNATVFRVTATDIFFYSAQGAGNIKIKDLDPELRNYFLHGTTNSAPAQQKSAAIKSVAVKTQNFHFNATEAFQTEQKKIAAFTNSKDALIVGGILLFFYLFLCYCFKRICEKCKVEPGILIWIPTFQLIRLLQAGGLSGWLFILFFIPIANVVMGVVMWAKICLACGKSAWLVLLMCIPVINLLLILYLAFSQSGEASETPAKSSPGEKIVLGS